MISIQCLGRKRRNASLADAKICLISVNDIPKPHSHWPIKMLHKEKVKNAIKRFLGCEKNSPISQILGVLNNLNELLNDMGVQNSERIIVPKMLEFLEYETEEIQIETLSKISNLVQFIILFDKNGNNLIIEKIYEKLLNMIHFLNKRVFL